MPYFFEVSLRYIKKRGIFKIEPLAEDIKLKMIFTFYEVLIILSCFKELQILACD